MSSIAYIGHGQLESSPENFSILHVVSHELSHVQEFKNEAFRQGEDIAEIRVKINMEMRGNGKLVAVSGETSATTKKRVEKDNDSLFEPYKRPENYNKTLDASKDNSIDENSKAMDSKKNIQELNIVSRRDSLESKISELELEIQSQENSSNLREVDSNTNPKKQELLREKNRIQEEIRILKMQEDSKKNFQMLSQAYKNMIDDAFNLGKNSNSKKNGNLLDVNS
jgi:hypothetical protein